MKKIEQKTSMLTKTVVASCVLHNICMREVTCMMMTVTLTMKMKRELYLKLALM